MSSLCLLIIYLFCEFIECIPNSTWSKDSRELKNGLANAVHTTETNGIIIKSSNTTASPTLWTKIEVKPPGTPLVKYHAKLGLAKNQSASNHSVSEVVTTAANRSVVENASTEVPRKGVNGETGHAFLYDDDDDDDDDYYDDDDDDDYDDDGYRIKHEEEDEVEEVVEDHAEEPEAAETEAQEEYESECLEM